MTDESFWQTLFGNKPEGAYISLFTLPGGESKHTRLMATATAWAELKAPTHDVYVGLGLRGQNHGERARGTEKDVTALTCLWADVDIAGARHKADRNYPPSEAAAIDLVRSMPLAPTMIVHSGGGLHAYWAFVEPYEIDDDNERRDLKAVSEGWQAILRDKARAHGWGMDSTGNLDRVLRVPGTVNHKLEADPVLVWVLSDGGPRYAGPSDFAEFVAAARPAMPNGRVYVNGATPETGALVIDPSASLDADALMLLIEDDARFAKTWKRKRTDLKDQSASGYHLSLACQLVSVGLSDQEIVNTIMQWGRKHSEPPRTRQDYYARTLQRARSGKSESDLIATADVAEAAAEGRDERLAFLRRALGIPLTRVIRRGAEHERVWHFIEIEGGSEIDLGRGKDMLDLTKTRGQITDAIGVVLPPMKQERWFAIAQLMQNVADQEVITESAFVVEFAERLRTHVADRHVEDAEQRKAAVLGSRPFIRAGQVYVHGPGLRKWLGFECGVDVESAQLNVWLRRLGFVAKNEVVWDQRRNKPIGRTYWVARVSVLHDISRDDYPTPESIAES